jgi:hypothetical protein
MMISRRPLSAELITIPDQGWRLLAACRDADPELFFPGLRVWPCLDQITQAKAICARAAAVEDLGAPSEPPE